jgi:hypothetical protein
MRTSIFWRAGAILVVLHLTWSMIARLFGVEFDITALAFDAFAFVIGCRHIWHETRSDELRPANGNNKKVDTTSPPRG